MAGRLVSGLVLARLGMAGTLILVALSVLNIACSASTSSSDAGTGASADTACGHSAKATCTEMQACTPANIEATYGDEPTCEARLKATCLDSLSAPSTGNTADKAEACAQAYGGYACADYQNKTNVPGACQQATGLRSNGGACLYAAQCQGGFCAIVPGSACGTCADLPTQGDSCEQLTTCGPTLNCAGDTLVCTAFAAQNQACGVGQPCGAALSCVAPGGAGTAGTCQPASQPGAACDGTLRTSASCDGALSQYCDGVTKQCAQTTYAAAGQACGYDSSTGTFVGCTAGTCEGADPSHGQLGTCVGRAADNGTCSVPDGGASTPSAGCLPSARCISSSGTCQVVTASDCH